MKVWRKLIVIALGLAIVGLVAYGFLPKPAPVEIAGVSRGDLVVKLTEEGMTRVKDRYLITAPLAGNMKRVALEAGATVKAGQVLAEVGPAPSILLDPRSREQAGSTVAAAEAALKAAEEAVGAREAEAKVADKGFARAKELLAAGYVTETEYERQEASAKAGRAALNSARFSVEVARHQLESAKAMLQSVSSSSMEAFRLKAPTSGVVLRVLRKSGGMVQPGEPIMEVADPASLEVQVDVLSEDAVRLSPGTRVIFERREGLPPLRGSVRVIEPAGFTKVSALGVEEQRVWVICDITSERSEWKALGDGYRLESSFILADLRGVLLVPESAIFRSGQGWAAFAYMEGIARLTQINIGRRNGTNAELLSGLSEGQQVITHPDRTLSDGAKVAPR